MTTFVGWTPPPGVEVVPPPCHVETEVDLLFSDRSELEGVRAGSQNWSSVGDGPSIVAYAIVQEYKPARELREWWILQNAGQLIGAWRSESKALGYAKDYASAEIIHVRQVPDPSREVVAWAVVRADGELSFTSRLESLAHDYAQNTGGTVVRLSGVRP